jgi:Abnormal spindle-like microcephaly-assoc'd, ASPM-SPD-2-Hydin
MTKSRALALVVSTLILLSRFSGAQANVNEGLELFTFYVDTNLGSDSNPGTQAQPFKTIGWAASQAVINNQNNKGTHVWINDGTYRESITLTSSAADTSLPITFEAINHGKVIVSGGVLYTGWSVYSGNSKIYTNAWNNTWGLCATPTGCPPSTWPQPNIMLRQEMVAVNGTVLTEVLSIGQMQTGTFYVDTTHKLIYVWPPTGTNMSTAGVDVATLPTLLTLNSKSNIVVRGLVFQYANSCRSNPAVDVTGSTAFPPSNILFDSDVVQWNNGQGLAIGFPITNFTIENTSALHNGDSGFQSYNSQLGLWQNDIAAYNNWRGAQGAYYACNVAGFHSWEAHTDSLNSFTAKYNQTYGIHWDTDNVNISGTSVIASQNLIPGLFSEVNPGPIALSNSYVCNQSSSLSGGGLAIRNSEGVSFTNGVLYNNTGAQFAVIGQPGGIQITDWLTGQVYDLVTQGVTNTNNIIEGIGSSQLLFNDASLNGADWITFLLNFNSNNNTWWNASNSTTPFVVPVPVLSTVEDFAGWQLTTLQDLSSTFSAPSGSPQNACAVTADANDYWLVVDNASVTANPAGSAIFNLTVMPLASFTGTVNFTLDGISEVRGLSAAKPASIVTSGTTQLSVNSATTTATGTYPITVIGNSGNQTRTVTVNVVIPVTSVRLSTASINFGSQQQNTTSAGQNVIVQNTGKTALSFTSATASTNFAISKNTCGTSLAAGASCTITVTFTPKSIGTINGTLTIVDGDVTSPQVVTLTGTGTSGPTVSLSPASLNFGSVLVKSASAPMTVTLTNTGGGTLTFTGGNAAGITITGTNKADFTQTNNCGSSVAAGASCTITVTFTPQASGTRSAAVTLTDNAGNGTQTVNLAGTGAYPTVTLTPSTLGFGNVEVNYSSGTLTSTVKNSGLVTLTISKIALSGTHPSEYTQTNNCIGSFAAGATCAINVIFSPTATGSQNASVTITDNTSAGFNTLNLTGSGALPTATLVPATDSFGSVTVGTTSSAKLSTLTNNSSFLLNVSSITVTGPNAGDFAQTNTCPVGGTLAGSATCTLSVTFTPSATGTRTATLTESDNTSAGTHTISLTGSGK